MDSTKTSSLVVCLRRTVFYLTAFVVVFRRVAVPRFKILITFYQVVVVLPSIYGVDMSAEYCESLPPPPNHIANCH
jgi:hypothetical protein